MLFIFQLILYNRCISITLFWSKHRKWC